MPAHGLIAVSQVFFYCIETWIWIIFALNLISVKYYHDDRLFLRVRLKMLTKDSAPLPDKNKTAFKEKKQCMWSKCIHTVLLRLTVWTVAWGGRSCEIIQSSRWRRQQRVGKPSQKQEKKLDLLGLKGGSGCTCGPVTQVSSLGSR